MRIKLALKLIKDPLLGIVLLCGKTWLPGEARSNLLCKKAVLRQSFELWLMEPTKKYG